MANLVMGAMSSIIPKLGELLKEEYNLQTSVKDRLKSLTQELELAQAALGKVGEVPWDQLDKQVQIWARKVRETSYDMEDVLDTFLVRVEGSESTEDKQRLQKYLKKVTNFFKKSKTRRKISGDIKNIMTHLQEVTEQCRRYKVEDIGARTDMEPAIDPRLHAMYTQANKLVGMDKSSGKLMSMLQSNPQRGEVSGSKTKIVSIVGVGGLGKTTLAKVVYDKIKGDFDCAAFIPVGCNTGMKKILMDILIDLDRENLYTSIGLDERQLIDELRNFFQEKKGYIIVIDDLWEERCWKTLKLAFAGDQSCESRIIITTRKRKVANVADEVYELPALPPDCSRKLFYTRIYGDERKYVDYQPDVVCDEIIWRCAGIPLAVITMASLLVDEPRDSWFEVYKSIGFGCKDNEDAENIVKKILSFSYYDLPSHLRTCLLYLSAFPEDSFIPEASLVWMWVAEGFVQKAKGKCLFEIGEAYFNDLINRSLIQEVDQGDIHGSRVHDMVLDFIGSMSEEENFFTICDNNEQGALVQSNNVVRRFADHNKAMVCSNQANIFDMSKVRTFSSLEWIVDTWAPLSCFKLLRVLNIGYYGTRSYDTSVRIEQVGHLLHLRFLGIKGRVIQKIPEEIGALKFLQTLDLMGSVIEEVPSGSSFPTQLVCLRMVLDFSVRDAEVFSVARLTSLEELSIRFCMRKPPRRFVKELGSLRELRVLFLLDARISMDVDEEIIRDLVESLRHIHKLQHLRIAASSFSGIGMEFELCGDLRRLVFVQVILWKLPHLDPLCHRKISHLDLCVFYMDEQELKTLGMLPELRFLHLDLCRSSATIHNISDSNACYFPKLRCLRLPLSMVLFVASNGDDGKRAVSFHIWNGKVDDSITMTSVSDAELQGKNEFSSAVQSETGRGAVREKSDEELQLVSVSDDGHPSRGSSQPSTLQHGIISALEKKKGSISTSREGDGEGAATLRFMPRLQVLHFDVPQQAAVERPNCCSCLGLEFLSSLREISVRVGVPSVQKKEVEAALRSAAQVHPNHPTLHIDSLFC